MSGPAATAVEEDRPPTRSRAPCRKCGRRGVVRIDDINDFTAVRVTCTVCLDTYEIKLEEP